MDPIQARVIFVNGINHSVAEAMDICQRLSSENGGIDIELNYNGCDGEGLIVEHNKTHAKKSIEELTLKIRNYVSQKMELCIIGHSMGCEITLCALEDCRIPKELLQKYVYIYIYGGIVKIPRAMGKEVVNYLAQSRENITENLHTQDAWAFMGGVINNTFRSNREGWATDSDPKKFDCQIIYPDYMTPCNLHNFAKSYLPFAMGKLRCFKQNRSFKSWNKNNDTVVEISKSNCCVKTTAHLVERASGATFGVGFYLTVGSIFFPPLASVGIPLMGYSGAVNLGANGVQYMQGES
ncbi:MAG: hypothetical protein JSR58_03860 [Verrucomicrobia bacterium]|nr:hypothetical protein [Verrucomicrobiota bacterium]